MKQFVLSLLILFSTVCLAQKHVVTQPKQSTTTAQSSNQNQVTTLTQELEQATQKNTYMERQQQEAKFAKNPFAISLYQPNYILPFYYDTKPASKIYKGNTPDNQKLNKVEFKAQISLKAPVWLNILHSKLSFYAAYTQLLYWQVYVKSAYFRETNYKPEAFFSYPVTSWNTWNIGIVHQSNGRGGKTERSWNRAYLDIIVSVGNWFLSMKPWLLIFRKDSSDIHNPDIDKYLGHGRVVLAYKIGGWVFSLMGRNNVESGFKRGAGELNIGFPLFGHFAGYVQYFTGYGQSLIEYKHYTNSVGIGVTLNNWI